MLESANIRLIPTDEEMIEVMATYANEVIQRILKRIDYTPCKDEIVKGWFLGHVTELTNGFDFMFPPHQKNVFFFKLV